MAQKLVVVTFTRSGPEVTATGAAEVNELLDKGWVVKEMHPMSPAGHGSAALAFASIVILEGRTT